MAQKNRIIDNEIFEEDWAEDISLEMVFVYVYLFLKCNEGGVWRYKGGDVKRFLRGKMFHADQFIELINQDGKQRVIVIEKDARGKHKKWFLPGYFKWQYGRRFSAKSPVHWGALKKILADGISPELWDGIDTREIQFLDIQRIEQIGYRKAMNSLSIPYEYDIDSNKNKTFIHSYIHSLKGASEKKSEQPERKPEQPKESPLVALAPPKPETKPETKPEPKPATRPVYLVQEDYGY
jgi:hypothetical protein